MVREVLDVMFDLAREGKTMVIVTHKPSILPLATRIVVIAGAQIVMDGPRDAVLQQLQRNSQAAASPPPAPAAAPAPAPQA